MGRNFPSPFCIHPMRTEIGRPNSSIRVPPDPGVHRGLRRFGTDPRASPIPEAGPRELRSSIGAFNAIQAQIQNFVDDRTTMLAAISHDLRTPLTKIRLRGEFVEDEEQRARLFRDVDDMQAMVDLALAFFRDDFQGEETTAFDFPEMLRTIVDNDQGSEIACDGAEHVPFRGRPFALKRAFTNLVDNAVKYGRSPELEFRVSPPGALTYRQT
jgi:signal transduction histidine kinase